MSSFYTLSLEQLCADVFAPFGDVASRPIVERRRYLPTMLNRSDAAQTFSFWISSVPAVCTLPLRVTRLERCVSGSGSFVCLILNAGGVELLLNRGPHAPRFGGAVVDDYESSDLRELRPNLTASPSAARRER